MSDGMSDGAAVNEIAVDVREAASKLVDVLKRAKRGHRGLTCGYLGIVNQVLEPHGFRLHERVQTEEWR